MTIVVYQTEPEGEYKTFNAPSSFSANDIDKGIAAKEGGGANWYGTSE